MDGKIVIACYRPRPGQEEALRELVANHVPQLRALGLATDRTPVVMRAGDGTWIEVFEWASKEAIEAAHRHPDVLTMWEAFGEACEHVPVGQLAEAAGPFSEFTPS